MARKAEDLSGKRFGRLVALEPTEERNGGSVVWRCKCDCGNIITVSARALNSGNKISCGCLQQKIPPNTLDLSGQRFGHLIAVRPTDARMCSSVVWACQCDCGNFVNVPAKTLKQGGRKSCGCLLKKSAQKRGESRIIDISGEKYHSLTAIEPFGKEEGKGMIWKCQCDCGNLAYVSASKLRSGSTRSCGCGKADNIARLKENFVFGTSLRTICRSDNSPQKNNTSGITGVSQDNGRWQATCSFQGYTYRQRCSSKNEAILVRRMLRKKRDEFLSWYNSLSPEEQKKEALAYKYTRKEFVAYMRQELMNILNENRMK